MFTYLCIYVFIYLLFIYFRRQGRHKGLKPSAFFSEKLRGSGSASLGVARPFYSQAFRIHALVILIFFSFLWGVSAGITRMETSFFVPHCSHAKKKKKKNAKLLWRGALFQALVEVSGLIFMDVRSPLGIVATFRWVYMAPFLLYSRGPRCFFPSCLFFGLDGLGLNGQFSFFFFFSSREDIFITSPAHRFPIQLPSK